MTFSEIKLYYHALLVQSAKVDDQVDFDFSVVVYIELLIYFDQCGSNTWVFCLRLRFEPLKKMNELLISRSSSCPFADRISSKHPQHIHLPEMQHRVESLFLCLLWGAKVFLESEALLFSWEMVWKLKKVLVHVKLSKEVKANNTTSRRCSAKWRATTWRPKACSNFCHSHVSSNSALQVLASFAKFHFLTLHRFGRFSRSRNRPLISPRWRQIFISIRLILINHCCRRQEVGKEAPTVNRFYQLSFNLS